MDGFGDAIFEFNRNETTIKMLAPISFSEAFAKQRLTMALAITIILSLVSPCIFSAEKSDLGEKPGKMGKVGKPAPDFTLPELLGKHKAISLQKFNGKVVLIDFWASWCPPCRKSLPELAQMQKRHPGMALMAITIDEEKEKAIDFLKTRDSNTIYLHDPKHDIAALFDLGGMPSAFLIDKQGKLRQRFDGYSESELKNIETEITKLLEEKSGG